MKRWVSSIAVLVLALGADALAQRRGSANDRLEERLEEQQQLLLKLIQLQQAQLEVLMKLVGGGAGKSLTLPAGAVVSPPPVDPPVNSKKKAPPPAPVQRLGDIEGRVSAKGGRLADAVVYVEDVSARPVRGVTTEMSQIDKQFSPRSLVVQRGTKVVFTNLDPIFHNVFSLTPGNSFDLGTYRKGDSPRPVVMNKPGLIKVFCNLHPQMIGHVLVVPNGFFAKVNKDGTFKIPGVPVGKRRVVAWMPNSVPVTREVDLSEDGASLNFSLSQDDLSSTHTNKFGQPYGSYKE